MNALCALDVLIHPQSGDESDIREAAVCAIKSLKKQIPKKPVISKANLTDVISNVLPIWKISLKIVVQTLFIDGLKWR